MRILHLSVVTFTQILLFITSEKIFKSRLLALFATLVFIPWQIFLEGYVLWIDTFIPLFLLPAFLLLHDKYSVRKYFLAGLFLGCALLLKQVVGPLIFLVVVYSCIKYKDIKRVLPTLLGLSIPIAFLIIWLTSLGLWKDFIFWTVSFNLGVFAQMGTKAATLQDIIKITPLIGIGCVSLIFLLKKDIKKYLLLAIFTLGSLSFVFARFDFIHLQPVIPFAVLSLVSVSRLIKKVKLSTLLSAYFIFSVIFLFCPLRNLLGDRVLFFTSQEYAISQKVLEYAKPGDSVFSIGSVPHINELTETLPPGRIFAFQFPWFMRVVGDAIYKSLILDSPKVIIMDKTVSIANIKITDYMPEIIEFADRYYEVVDKIDSVEIMVKR